MTLAQPHLDVSRRDLLRNAALFGGGAALAGLPLSRVSAAGAEEWPTVAALIHRYVSQRKVANMVAALGWRQDAPTIFGDGDLAFSIPRPAGADTLYRIYSMTKPITGMAAMILIDEGKLRLDQPVAEILPKFAEMKVQKRYDGGIGPDDLEPAVRPITIRHLLTHTSGLGYSIVQSGPISAAYADAGLVPGLVSRLQMVPAFRGTPVGSLQAFADRLAEMPLVYQPGTQWSYSVGLDLMGRIIEVVAGEPFDAFLKRRIFDPAGMVDTGFQVPTNAIDRLTANYYLLGEALIPIDMPENSVFLDEPPFPFGGAGLVSTPRDYDRFLQMLAGYGAIEGTRVMSEAAVRLGTSDLLPDTMADDGGFQFGERDFGFGAAGLVGTGDAEGLYGWFGAAGTCGLVNLKYGLRHSLFTQYMPAMEYPVYEEFPLAVARDGAAMLLSA